jgi:hypothetical protein
VAGGWRRLHHKELHNLYDSPNIVSEIKSRRMRWVRQVARMREIRNSYKIPVGNLKGRDQAEDISIGGRTILEWILGK